MQVSIDEEMCQGHARCIFECPEVFEADPDSGHARVVLADVPEELQAAVQRAADSCPERAVRVNAPVA